VTVLFATVLGAYGSTTLLYHLGSYANGARFGAGPCRGFLVAVLRRRELEPVLALDVICTVSPRRSSRAQFSDSWSSILFT